MKIFITNTKEKIDEFNKFIANYTIKPLDHVCLDFEFNNGKVALMQMLLNNTIWITNPYTINKKLFIKKILTNKKIYKVLHGADSLDIPFLYSYLSNKKYITKFTNKLFDTRLLCEYYKISQNDPNPKCSLYTALLYFKVIDNKKHQELTKFMEKPIYKIKWSIDQLTPNLLNYVAYDVYYLQDLLTNIFKSVMTNTPNRVKEYKLIIKLIRLNYLARNNIIEKSNTGKKLANNFVFSVAYVKNGVSQVIQNDPKIMRSLKLLYNNNIYVDN